ncbi:MAG TPA: hypothetical protein VF808_03275 [Ktedonobacterales bacterium]
MSQIVHPRGSPRVQPRLRWSVWSRWTAANTLAETLGLGATLLLGILLFTQAETVIGPIGVALLGILLGALLEGGIVGTAQWLALRGALPALSWRSWAAATAIGAGLAWTLGMIPSTLFALLAPASSATTGAQAQEPTAWALYGGAAALGLVGGAVLALAQWRTLRYHVPRAVWWLPANSCAWAVGIALIFVGTSLIPASGLTPGSAAALIACVIAAGATVGAINGLALIWLLRERDRQAVAQAVQP